MHQLLADARQFFLHWHLVLMLLNSGDCAVCVGIKSIQAAFSFKFGCEYEELGVLPSVIEETEKSV